MSAQPAQGRRSGTRSRNYTARPISASLQALVDALSVALRRPVLLDDAALHPLAYSRQWGELDAVRLESILRRGASPAVRRALLEQGIARAHGVVRTRPVPEIGMEERVCVPLRAGGAGPDADVLGYLWLLDPRRELGEEELARLEETARRLGDALARSEADASPEEGALIARLCAPVEEEREAAAEEVRARGLLPDGPLVVCAVAPLVPGADLHAVVRGTARRLARGHALAGVGPALATLLLARADPALRVLGDAQLAEWLHDGAAEEVAVGQSDVAAGLHRVAAARHQATVALRVALGRPPAEAHAAWAALGADRLVAQLPAGAAADVPPALARLLREEPVLARTLAAFLDAAGDVKATAAALSLHRSGLYYRLRSIEERTGLRLDRGEDRLLAQLALRLVRAD